jgi:cytidylate kinase
MGRKTVEMIIENRLREWEVKAKTTERGWARGGRPVITIARLRGSGGEAVARRLGDLLGMQVYDREIIEAIADRAQVREAMVARLDEVRHSVIRTSIAELIQDPEMTSGEYLVHLCEVVGSLGKIGDAVIVGRQAHTILSPSDRFAVRLVAEEGERIRRVMKLESCPEQEAHRMLERTDRERIGFAKQSFDRDATDPGQYDLLINAFRTGLYGAAESIASAYRAWRRVASK